MPRPRIGRESRSHYRRRLGAPKGSPSASRRCARAIQISVLPGRPWRRASARPCVSWVCDWGRRHSGGDHTGHTRRESASRRRRLTVCPRPVDQCGDWSALQEGDIDGHKRVLGDVLGVQMNLGLWPGAGHTSHWISAVSGNWAYQPNQKARWAGMRGSRSPSAASATSASSVTCHTAPWSSMIRPFSS